MANQDYIVIPREIYANKNISPSARIIYGIILLRSHQTGYCWASNAYLAEQSGFAERSVSRLISELKNQGLLRIEQDPERKKIRRLYIANYDRIADKIGKVSLSDTASDGSQNWQGNSDKYGERINNKYKNNYKNNYNNYNKNYTFAFEREFEVYNSDIDFDAIARACEK
jgi:hypothetical protein